MDVIKNLVVLKNFRDENCLKYFALYKQGSNNLRYENAKSEMTKIYSKAHLIGFLATLLGNHAIPKNFRLKKIQIPIGFAVGFWYGLHCSVEYLEDDYTDLIANGLDHQLQKN
jgi:hypothetical protein